jgi:hypothetical protein
MRKIPLHGLMAELDGPESLLEAARRARDHGFRRLDAYAPFPVHGLTEALGFKPRGRLPVIVFCGGLLGACLGFGLAWWASTTAYPLHVAGRPLNSWPAFIPITFETTVLCAAFAAVLGMLGLNGLPMPYHPVFNVEAFAGASRNRFFLCIEARDERFEVEATRRFLESLRPVAVYEVPG